MELVTDFSGELFSVYIDHIHNDAKESSLEEYQESDLPSRSGNGRKEDRSYSYVIP